MLDYPPTHPLPTTLALPSLVRSVNWRAFVRDCAAPGAVTHCTREIYANNMLSRMPDDLLPSFDEYFARNPTVTKDLFCSAVDLLWENNVVLIRRCFFFAFAVFLTMY